MSMSLTRSSFGEELVRQIPGCFGGCFAHSLETRQPQNLSGQSSIHFFNERLRYMKAHYTLNGLQLTYRPVTQLGSVNSGNLRLEPKL